VADGESGRRARSEYSAEFSAFAHICTLQL
jgi:hypothetical protein